jgi:hypothetical protein
MKEIDNMGAPFSNLIQKPSPLFPIDPIDIGEIRPEFCFPPCFLARVSHG